MAPVGETFGFSRAQLGTACDVTQRTQRLQNMAAMCEASDSDDEAGSVCSDFSFASEDLPDLYGWEDSEDSEGGEQPIDRAEEEANIEAEPAGLDLQPYRFEPPAGEPVPAAQGDVGPGPVAANQIPNPDRVGNTNWYVFF